MNKVGRKAGLAVHGFVRLIEIGKVVCARVKAGVYYPA